MVLNGFQKENYVLQVQEDRRLLDGWKRNVHGSLKNGRGIVESERHSRGLENAVMASKRTLLAVS